MDLSPRLTAAAELVKGERVADVGTDHAWLPIYLVRSRHVKVRASDINAAPCERAREHIRAVGLTDEIEVVHAAGLDGIESFAPDSVVICGMGGEMIASILAASDYPRISRCQLVLQPQSKQDVLRMWLCSQGFAIRSESIVFDEGKYYQLLSADYEGDASVLLPIEYRLGRGILERTLSGTEYEWLKQIRNIVARRVEGRRNGAAMSDELAEVQQTDIVILRQIHQILEQHPHQMAEQQIHQILGQQPHQMAEQQIHQILEQQPHQMAKQQPHQMAEQQTHQILEQQAHQMLERTGTEYAKH